MIFPYLIMKFTINLQKTTIRVTKFDESYIYFVFFCLISSLSILNFYFFIIDLYHQLHKYRDVDTLSIFES